MVAFGDYCRMNPYCVQRIRKGKHEPGLFCFVARMHGGHLRDGAEGRVVVRREGECLTISPRREGSRYAWAAFLASR